MVSLTEFSPQTIAPPFLSVQPDRDLMRSGGASLDHLVGAQHYRWGYRKAERLGGLAVHDHLEPGRKLHREIARFLAAQDAIDIGGGATIVVYHVGSVGEQTAVSGKVRRPKNRRDVAPGRRQYDQRAMCGYGPIRHDN